MQWRKVKEAIVIGTFQRNEICVCERDISVILDTPGNFSLKVVSPN